MGVFSFLEKRVTAAELAQELSVVAANASEQVFFKELALQTAISLIANSISKCEFKVFEHGNEVQNELYYLLNVNPNPNQSSSQFLNALINRYYRNGEALIVPDINRKRLYVADGYSCDEKSLSENIYSCITVGNETIRRKYKASEVFLFKLDDIKVKSLIDGAYQQYGKVIQSAIDGFIRSNGKKYKLVLDQYKAGDSEFAKTYENILKKQLEAFVSNANVVYPQFKGMDLMEFNTSSVGVGQSADIINMRKEIFETVATAFKIPLSMMSGNITNINDISNLFLTFAVDPVADMLSEELTRKMFSFNEWKKGSYVRCDTSSISHVDILDVADKVDKAISSGVVCIDEVRKRLDMEILGNDFGQKHFVTKNYADADTALTEQQLLLKGGSNNEQEGN